MVLSPNCAGPGRLHWFHCRLFGAVGGTREDCAPNCGPGRSATRLAPPIIWLATRGALLPLGAVGTVDPVAFGDTLKDWLRGPEGAVGGGVCPRTRPAKPWKAPTSDLGEANGGRGETDAKAGDIRVARGPVGAASSLKRDGWAVCIGGCTIAGRDDVDAAGETALGPEGDGFMNGPGCSMRGTARDGPLACTFSNDLTP